MSDVISFTVPLPPRALRRNTETAVRGYRARLVREYQEQVWCAGRAPAPQSACTVHHLRHICAPWPKAHLVLTWRHHRAGPDADNALASCKYLIDVLKATGPRPLGIIVDDAPEHLSVAIHVEKVATRAEECIAVLIERRQG